MNTIKATIEKGVLTIRIPVDKTNQPSKTGKTLRVASSEGNQQTDLQVNGKPVIVGLNAYIYAK